MPIGSVCDRSVSVRISASRNSFHEVIRQKMAVAARPGRANGSATRRKAPHRVSPSTMAASSSSTGRSWK
jgi:hypothetical protein